MNTIQIVTNDNGSYDKVVILLHGGGGSGQYWKGIYDAGWFGDSLTNVKYVFPTSTLEGGLWYNSYKNDCGLADDCAYDLDSIQQSATAIENLIEQEMAQLDNDPSRVFLGGFSQGGQITGYVQIARLKYALGGTIIMSSYPLPPLSQLNPQEPDEAQASGDNFYTGQDMRWMVWLSQDDHVFPLRRTWDAYFNMFETLGIATTLKNAHTMVGA